MNFITIITFLVILFYVEAVDYCSPSLCKAGKKHIACGNNGKFLASCPQGATMIDLKPHMKTIIDMHNKFRNRIAGGEIGSYSPAAKMATIAWNDQLASMSAFNVKQCYVAHDECRNTPFFKKSGQNIASRTSNAPVKKSVTFLVAYLLNKFFIEWKNANMAIIKSYPKDYIGPKIGHFTTAVNEKCAFVGCTASRYTRDGKDNFLMTCNYSFTNVVGKATYNATTKAAIGCKTGTNPQYSNLCSKAEVINFK